MVFLLILGRSRHGIRPGSLVWDLQGRSRFLRCFQGREPLRPYLHSHLIGKEVGQGSQGDFQSQWFSQFFLILLVRWNRGSKGGTAGPAMKWLLVRLALLRGWVVGF